MNYQESVWNEFRRCDFTFEDKPAVLICPDNPVEGNK